MRDRILIVDDDTRLLHTLRERLSRQFDIYVSDCAEQGLRLLATRGPFTAVVSDMWMPGMNGIEFLKRAKEVARDTVRIILTANGDQESAIAAVNEGYVFRYLRKPCAFEDVEKAVEAAVEQYNLVTMEKDFLSKTLTGTLRTLTDALALLYPHSFSRVSRIRRITSEAAKSLQVPRPWELELAGILSQIGWINDIVELEISRNVESDGAREELENPLEEIPRLEGVQELLSLIDQPGAFSDLQNPYDQVCLDARLLSLILEYDQLCEEGMSNDKALSYLREKTSTNIDVLIDAIADVIKRDQQCETGIVNASSLPDKAVLLEDLYASDGRLLLKEGQEIGHSLKLRLIKISHSIGLNPIKIALH